MEKETLEEAAERLYPVVIKPILDVYNDGVSNQIDEEDINEDSRESFIDGAKWQQERMYSEEDIIGFAEFIAKYPDKNRNYTGQMLHAKSKYDGAERTIDLLQVWFEHFKNK
jgi:hypothetical protein